METSQKKYTLESLVELIRKDPDLAFEEMLKMPSEERRYFLRTMPDSEHSEILARAILKNLEDNVDNKVETP